VDVVNAVKWNWETFHFVVFLSTHLFHTVNPKQKQKMSSLPALLSKFEYCRLLGVEATTGHAPISGNELNITSRLEAVEESLTNGTNPSTLFIHRDKNVPVDKAPPPIPGNAAMAFYKNCTRKKYLE
jgi:hypothetical protein